MEKERDFYFGKLRNIELICQEKEGEGDPTLQKIVDILYATDVSLALTDNKFHQNEQGSRCHQNEVLKILICHHSYF